VRAGQRPSGESGSIPGYLATWHIAGGWAAVDPVIEQLGQAHLLAWHIGDFLTDLANANASRHTLA